MTTQTDPHALLAGWPAPSLSIDPNLWQQAVAKATDADNPRAQGTLLRETRQKIAKDVLTEEQRGKLRPARGGDRRGGDRRGGDRPRRRRRGGADAGGD